MDLDPYEIDIRNLYPVQRRPDVTEKDNNSMEDVSLDNEDRQSFDSNSVRNGKESSQGKRRVTIQTVPSERKPSDAAVIEKLQRKMTMLPSSVPGPDGKRQSSWVDYTYYDRMLSRKPTIVSLSVNREEESKMKLALKEASEAARKVKLSGLNQITVAGSWVARGFWIFLFLFCLVMLIYEIRNAINDYKTSPITTTFTITNPKSIQFPDVYICMGNSIDRNYVLKHPEVAAASSVLYATLVGGEKKRRKRSTMMEMEMEEHETPWEWTMENYARRLREAVEDAEDDEEFERIRREVDAKTQNETIEQFRSNGQMAYDFLMNAGFKIEETFLNCSFRGYGQKTYNCSQIVTSVLDPNYFKCFVVNLPDNEQQVLANKGLQLLIDSRRSSYPRSENETKPNKYAGIYVSVSDKFDPTNWYKSVIRPGSYTKLTMTANKVKLMNLESGPLYQPCIDNGTSLYRFFDTSYSRTACQMDCFIFAIYRQCKCIQWMDKSLIKKEILDSAPFCAFKHAKSCIIPNVTSDKAIMDKVNKCREKCHTLCTSTRYDTRGSWSTLNPHAFPKTAPVDQLIRLDVAFGRLEVSVLEQAGSQTIAQMIAIMGGQVNLWLGASMVTLLQIPIFLSFYFCYRSYHRVVDWAWSGQ